MTIIEVLTIQCLSNFCGLPLECRLRVEASVSVHEREEVRLVIKRLSDQQENLGFSPWAHSLTNKALVSSCIILGGGRHNYT